jgi:hypothetical protein
MVIYSGLGLLGLQLTNSLFANAGVVPPFVMARRSMAVQQKLGVHLQKQQSLRILKAASGGFRHSDAMRAELEHRHTPRHGKLHLSDSDVAPGSAPPPLSQLSADSAVSFPAFRGVAVEVSSQPVDVTAISRPPPSTSPVLTPRDPVAALANSKAPFNAMLE